MHSNDAFAPVVFLVIEKISLKDKLNVPKEMSCRLSGDQKKRMIDFAIENMQSMSIPPSLGGLDMNNMQEKSIEIKNNKYWIHRNHVCVYQSHPYYAISGITAPNSLDISNQVFTVLKEIQSQLESLELNWNDVVLMHVYVRDMNEFGVINKAYSEFFDLNPPPRYTL